MAAKGDPLLDWFKIPDYSSMPSNETSENEEESNATSKNQVTSGYKRLIQAQKEKQQQEEDMETDDHEQSWVSYFDQEEDSFVAVRPFRTGARPGDDDYTPIRSTEVFDTYYQKPHTYNPSYPITSCFKAIVDTIENNQVTVIEGATGERGCSRVSPEGPVISPVLG